ncbi:MAG: cytidine deaminase [Lentimicrobium sp.]|jgi:cytidine deaminase|nr:cytidine deaminase [Lentimicrobium sp.]
MEQKSIQLRISYANHFNELDGPDRALLNNAVNAASGAYAPYSGFKVGAAVQLTNGKVVTGNNQENAAYPSGLCAERVAVFAAMSQFPDQKIEAIAITIKTPGGEIVDPVSPCGACRQVLMEYENLQQKKIRVIFTGETGKAIVVESVSDLLPLSFTAGNLKYRP